MNCIFCKIINGEIPAYKVYEDEKVLGSVKKRGNKMMNEFPLFAY
jgi:diadenosine tetraphosphate (Ap4A) HIT family hydrolase